ncbi:1691_t:CDS:2 [Rhizophagus irregularis]|nr:1691_t:CDS:2 [Rhizophagus irregularis]
MWKVLVSAAFKIPTSENHDNINLPYGSFVGRIYEEVEQNGSDCKFGVNLLEYNNFSFASKEKINFRIHIVYEAGPTSRFIKLASRLQVGKLIFISGFFDLNENEIPFVEAKEIDILNEFSDNPSQTQSNNTLQSPFHVPLNLKASEEELPHAKFKSNKKLLQSPPQKKNKTIEIIDNDEQIDNKSEEEQKSPITSASKIEAKDSSISEKSTKKNSKRKMELSDLSIQRLEKAAKNTKVKTRSQKRYENQKEDNVLMEAEEST